MSNRLLDDVAKVIHAEIVNMFRVIVKLQSLVAPGGAYARLLDWPDPEKKSCKPRPITT